MNSENTALPLPTPSKKSDTHMPGEEGVWVFIGGDMLVFTLLFAVFLFYRAMDVETFLVSQSQLNQNYGAINTLFLLTSSLFVVLALQSARNRKQSLVPRFLSAALVCGLAFSAVKIFEYREKINQDFTLLTDDFYMFYYVLTVTHFIHVIIGMFVLLFLIKNSMKKDFSESDLRLLEGGACFWHMVDLLWIVLFPLLYLMK